MSDTTAGHAEGHSHPGWQLYVIIAVILFVLTAMEVGAYEIADRGITSGFGLFVGQMFVEILLVLSAAKFALVAMFYMHLKQDSRLFTGVFVFPLIIAAIIVVALMALMAYHFAFARSVG